MPKPNAPPPSLQAYANASNDNEHYAHWDIPEEAEPEEAIIVAAAGVSMVGVDGIGQPLLRRPFVVVGSGQERATNVNEFLKGYQDLMNGFTDPGLESYGVFETNHRLRIVRSAERSLKRSNLSLLAAYTVLKSKDAQYSGLLSVSNALIRHTTAAAIEDGMPAKSLSVARSLRGRLWGLKPIEPEEYGWRIGSALICKLLPDIETIRAEYR